MADSNERDERRPQRQVYYTEDGAPRVGLPKWPDELKALAFELWWLKFQRNAAKVCDYLNAMPDQDGDHPADELVIEHRDLIVDALQERKIAVSTIYAWARRERWAEEVDKRHRQIAPALFAQVDQELELASLDAMRRLIFLVKDPSIPPKIQLDASNSILDRTGHTAWVRPSDDGKMTGPQRDYSGSVAGKDTKDLFRLAFGSDPVDE